MVVWPSKGEPRGEGGEGSQAVCRYRQSSNEVFGHILIGTDGTSVICILSFMDYTVFTQTTDSR